MPVITRSHQKWERGVEQIKSEPPEGTNAVGSQGQSLEEVMLEQRPEVVWELTAENAPGRRNGRCKGPEPGGRS